MKTELVSKTLTILIALVGGAILPLAFAPFNYYLAALISLLLLLWIWDKSSPKAAFQYGWFFGLAFFGFGVHWVYISIHEYGNAPIILAGLIVVTLVFLMALYFAIQGYLLNKIYPENNWKKLLLAFPATLVILEWLRGWLLTGFPWLFLGYSQLNTPLSGFAPILGVYGVSFFVAQSSGACFAIIKFRKNYRLVTWLLLYLATIWTAGLLLNKIDWTKKSAENIEVSLIQGNIPIEQKWRDSELWPILNIYSTLSAKNFNSRIIVWPEAAIPTFPENIKPYLTQLSAAIKNNSSTIAAGAPIYDQQQNLYYNGLITFGIDHGRYHKRHLLPFGEYMPFKFALKWLANFLIIPMSDFSSGGKMQPKLTIDSIVIAPFICYEIAYPGLALDYMPEARLIITISDDSWFGDSIAQNQHLEIAQMRSLETGRYQLFATNTGISAIIDQRGKIIAKTKSFTQEVLNGEAELYSSSTPWVKFGRYCWLGLMLLMLLISRKKLTTSKR